MDKRAFWIWLQNAFGPGSAKPRQIVERTGDPVEFYRGGVRLWSSFRFISDKEIAALNAYGPEQAAAALEYCLRLDQKVITPDSSMYPQLLKQIYAPPAVLYARGDIPVSADDLWIGVVGTRKASQVGLDAARDICYHLGRHDAVIVSGGALGVDSEAHRGALNAGARTVALLPCGLDYPYLMDNALLRREILDRGGALVTEFSMNTPVQRGSFQIRNRLISGISHGVLVAEAPEKSGALITAKHALDQNREVFAFVGEDEKAFAGCIRLAEDGAKRVYSAEDILKSFLQSRPRPVHKPEWETVKPVKRAVSVKKQSVPKTEEQKPDVQENDFLSDVARRVLETVAGTPMHPSEIELRTGIAAAEILAALTELELFGMVKALPGQRFTKA